MEYKQNFQTECRNEYEQEVDLKDLMFHILYRWRSLLLAAVVICALAGGYALRYNESVLPGKRAGVQEKLEEQQRLVKEAKEKGESADQVQKKEQELKTELEGLMEYSLVKYCVIGFAGGLFGLAVCYGFSYALSDKMRGERELRDRYGYYLLGTFPRRRKGKPLSGPDRFLEKKEGISGKVTREEVNRIVAVNITNLAKDGGVFLVTGTADTERLQELTKAILPQLQENVALMIGADMNTTAGTLEALAECDGVILVEERGKSLRGKIQKECESIGALGKKVVGYVVV